MAGINPNLGKNLNVKQVQLNATAKVDTQKPEDNEAGKAKPCAVWISRGYDEFGLRYPEGARPGDVIIGDQGRAWRIIVDGQGFTDIVETQLRASDFEKDRGDLRRQ